MWRGLLCCAWGKDAIQVVQFMGQAVIHVAPLAYPDHSMRMDLVSATGVDQEQALTRPLSWHA